MALKALSGLLSATSPIPLVGTSSGYIQKILLEPKMLSHVFRHRQNSPKAFEAGGQLFGLIRNDFVRIVSATGPYANDKRSRYCYRSNPASAQQAINTQANAGMLYLGEWHSHAEDYPAASGLDKDAMNKLITSSHLNVNALLMLIIGRHRSPEGLALFSVAIGDVKRWTLSCENFP
jgi:integrative and conjugative element protein (TIGR02256 family)